MNQEKSSRDMIMEEFRRVTSERDDYKKKLEESEKQREELVSQWTSITGDGNVTTTEKGDSSSIDTPSALVKSPMSSVLGLGIFSPKQKTQPTSDNKDVSEEFFSYDEEIPTLQAEVKEKAAEIEGLRSRVSTLETDLTVAQDKSSTLLENLEKTTWELQESKETAIAGTSLQDKITSQNEELASLKAKLQATDTKIASLKADLAKEKTTSAEAEMAANGQIASLEKNIESTTKSLKASQSQADKLNAQIKQLLESKEDDVRNLEGLMKTVDTLQQQVHKTPVTKVDEAPSQPVTSLEVPSTTATAKKKNKKKKKGGNSAATASEPPETKVCIVSRLTLDHSASLHHIS
jgi:chromosome segregation ATPase